MVWRKWGKSIWPGALWAIPYICSICRLPITTGSVRERRDYNIWYEGNEKRMWGGHPCIIPWIIQVCTKMEWVISWQMPLSFLFNIWNHEKWVKWIANKYQTGPWALPNVGDELLYWLCCLIKHGQADCGNEIIRSASQNFLCCSQVCGQCQNNACAR